MPPPRSPQPRRQPTVPSISETTSDEMPTKRRSAREKKRITLSLPTRVATLLRTTADTEQRIFLDIILTAFITHANDVDADMVAERSSNSARGGRRRAGSGRTQIPLNIKAEDLEILDARVSALGLDRSSYITELLVRELTR